MVDKETCDKVVKLRKQGYTMLHIARTVVISVNEVRKILGE